jgi:cysteine sulfinate desulfinase/cysteine desulfurase-like protein
MGLEAHAGSAIRVSASWRTSIEEVQRFMETYTTMAKRLARG